MFHILPVKRTEETISKALAGYRYFQYKHTFWGQEHISLHDTESHTLKTEHKSNSNKWLNPIY